MFASLDEAMLAYDERYDRRRRDAVAARQDQGAHAGGQFPAERSRAVDDEHARRIVLREYGSNGDRACSSRRRSAGCCSTRRSRPTSRSSTASVQEARHQRDRRASWSTRYPQGGRGRRASTAQGPRLPVRRRSRASRSRSTTSRRRREGRRSSTSTRTRPRRSRASSAAASSPTASAARRRSRSGPTPPTRCRSAMEDELQGRAVQPHRHDGRLGCPREHDAGPPDRRHARPGGQPPRRHDPPPDQVELP